MNNSNFNMKEDNLKKINMTKKNHIKSSEEI